MEWYQIVLGVIVGLILLMILVIIHEPGHAIAAVRNGVKVEEFGIGFPPRAKILGRYKGTLITINWLLPLGGFCQLKGESDAAKDKGSFGAASFWAKTKILLAGVLMNLVAAMAIFTVLAFTGLPKVLPNQFVVTGDNRGDSGIVSIVGVISGSPAEQAGLEKGDEIHFMASDNNRSTGSDIELVAQVSEFTKANAGRTVMIEYDRGGSPHVTHATLNATSGSQGYLGVQTEQKQYANVRATWSAPLVGVATTLQFVGATFSGLSDMVANLFSGLWGFVTGNAAETKNIAAAGESVAGPVSILGVIFPSALAAGPTQLFWLMGIISLTLTVMNVLPIPGLDGGRWYLLAGFKLFKKKLTKEREAKVNGVGMLVLFGLIIIVTISDIVKLF